MWSDPIKKQQYIKNISANALVLEYISAKNKEEFDDKLPQLMDFSKDYPVIMEVFTDMDIDAECINTILTPYRLDKPSLKHQIGKMMPTEMKKTIKRIIK